MEEQMSDIILLEFNAFGFGLRSLDIVAHTTYIRCLNLRVSLWSLPENTSG